MQKNSAQRAPVPTESVEQQLLFRWARFYVSKYPELALLYHIPNEIKWNAAQGKQRKDIGVKSGVPDLCLPVARGQYHGLYIEMKAERGRVSENQKKWLKRLMEQGYLAKVCYGFDEAIRCIKEYYSYGE